jgi:hypothetical protein
MRKRVLLRVFSVCAAALPVPMKAFPPLIAASIPSVARQQSPIEQPPQQPRQSPAPATHKIKIWTNENLIATRTPADIYMFEKEAQAAADQAAAFQTIASCFAPDQPEATVEETQKAIAETRQAVREAENAVSQAKRQVTEDPENLRTRDQAELDRRTSEMNKLLERLQMLQERLRELSH